MPVSELARLNDRAAKVNRKAKVVKKLTSITVPIETYKGLIALAEKSNIGLAEARRWAYAEGLKAWGARVAPAVPTVSQRYPAFNAEPRHDSQYSTSTLLSLARQERARGLVSIEEGEDVNGVEAMVKKVVESGAMGKVPVDVLMPGSAPIAEPSEEQDIDETE
jgi:hypothetical protein